MLACILPNMDLEDQRRELLQVLGTYPHCDYFLRQCVENMRPEEIETDLRADPDHSLLQHFRCARHMTLLEGMFTGGLAVLDVPQEALQRRPEFNLGRYNLENFESARGILRLVVALSKEGFSEIRLLDGPGLADLRAKRDGVDWYVEAKTLILQTKTLRRQFEGREYELVVDKFQPRSCNIAEYIQNLTRALASEEIPKARAQLLNTEEELGQGRKMAAIVVNWFAADVFLEEGHLREVYIRLRGKANGWEKDYLAEIDALAFLTNRLFVLP